MWMILNKFLGFQYIEYRDSACSFIARVYIIPNGELRMKGGWCRGHYDANLKKDGTFIGENMRGARWIPLTWKKESTKEEKENE